MGFTIIVMFKDHREEFDVNLPAIYDAKMEGAKLFLEKYPLERPHDDRRRPYPIPITPSWLVTGGYVFAHTKNDRRVKYA